MRLAPGADLRQLQKCKPGETVILPPGGYVGGASLSGLHDVTINAGGAVLTGGVNALKLTDCKNITLNGIEIRRPSSYGLFFVGCQHVIISRPIISGCGMTGILTTHVDDVQLVDATISGSVKEHGAYFSERGSKVRVVGGRFSHCFKSAVQINGDKGGISDVEVRNIIADHCQDPGGAAAIQLAYVTGGRVLNNTISDHCGRAGIALFWHTRDVTVDSNRFGFAAGRGAMCISVDGTSKGTIGPMNTADPRVPLVGRG